MLSLRDMSFASVDIVPGQTTSERQLGCNAPHCTLRRSSLGATRSGYLGNNEQTETTRLQNFGATLRTKGCSALLQAGRALEDIVRLCGGAAGGVETSSTTSSSRGLLLRLRDDDDGREHLLLVAIHLRDRRVIDTLPPKDLSSLLPHLSAGHQEGETAVSSLSRSGE